jgi:DNA polymerase-3 subunit gamma/tau
MAAPNTDSDSSRPQGEYVVVARRYRPRDFAELVGQSQVSRALANAIITNRVGHAYLFTGARGVGKTSTARIFAKCLNCLTSGPTTTPCGHCDVCESVAEGEDVDVVEIDGASNRNIDDIRQLRANINVRPSRARFKIYIIDEVHMLTTQAFNALLKTLEEPPEHVKFIFCTTDADKIPITVLSRCQRYDFSPMEVGTILDRLKMICENEGVAAEPEALQLLARRANGSMRDSQSLLEQLLSFCGKTLTAQSVHEMLGTADTAHLRFICEALVNRKAADAWTRVDQAIREGVDVGALAEQLLGYLRDSTAALVGCEAELMLQAPGSEAASLAELGRQMGLETMLAAMQILDQTLVRMRQSPHGRTLLEMALVRICCLQNLDALPHLLAMARTGSPPPLSAVVGQTRSAPATNPVVQPTARTQATTPPPETLKSPPPQTSTKVEPARTSPVSPGLRGESSSPAPTKTTAPEPAPQRRVDSPQVTNDEAIAAWHQVVKDLGEQGDGLIADWAKLAESAAMVKDGTLRLTFYQRDSFAQKNCERPDRRGKLEKALEAITGRPWSLEFASAPDPKPTAPPPPKQTNANQFKRKQAAARQPLVQKAMELFEAEVMDVAPPPEPKLDDLPAAGESPSITEGPAVAESADEGTGD